MDFSNVIFADECLATVSEPDEWAKYWISSQIGLQSEHFISKVEKWTIHVLASHH